MTAIDLTIQTERRTRAIQRAKERNIAGWHELEWADVVKVKDYFPPWNEEHLVLDMVDSVDENVIKARAYCE